MSSLTLSFLLLWVCHFFMDFFTGIWPIYKTLIGFDIATAGLIAGISGFLGELLQIGFGYFSDQGYRKKVLMFGLVFSSAIIWITYVDGVFPSFILLLLLMIGSGAFHPSAVGMAGILARQHKAKGILFFSSGGALGFALSQLIFTKLIGGGSGHATIMLFPLALVFVFLIFHRFPQQNSVKPSVSLKGFFGPIMHCKKPLTLLYFSQVCSQLIYTALMFLLPDVLNCKGCHSWLCYGGGHFCFVLGSALTMLPAGYLADKYGQKHVLLFAISLAATFLYFFLAMPNPSFHFTAVVLACLGAFLGIVNPLIVSWGNRLVPESPSTVSALLMGFAWCLGNLGYAFAGLLAIFFTNQPIIWALGLMGLALAIAFSLILFIPRPAPIAVTEGSNIVD